MYFACYTWQTQEGLVIFMNKIFDSEHPLQWLARTQASDPKAHCRLISWQKLTEQEATLAREVVSDP